jgi:hypothetical protein
MTHQIALTNSDSEAQYLGTEGGRRAGELFILHSARGTYEDIRRSLVTKIPEAKAEARGWFLTSDDSDDRQRAEYWLAFYAELERYISTSQAGQ